MDRKTIPKPIRKQVWNQHIGEENGIGKCNVCASEIKQMDFGGISDDSSSAGVDFFKSGFNGKTFEKVGEFDVSKSGMKSYLFGKAIQFRYKK